ncbi:hypothetical protein [Thiorhodovibrio frisius]|uniref:Uncharacterized protein n=1 Tax=Thiorhodovibrio frisius TaxID=631362 RepID=H8Z1A2_9GAMM|nr:hypothetical protein [Thiorhodovibrio frisius]EIC21417.1 hypothetical protein Thi970DRAFT_01624 [Thiorhodovibrio frisius]WPL24003.1 hypothetical protein Thiofri_04213 [Thiorhodovibrio frisius]
MISATTVKSIRALVADNSQLLWVVADPGLVDFASNPQGRIGQLRFGESSRRNKRAAGILDRDTEVNPPLICRRIPG